MADARLFVATPLHDDRVHAAYTAGLLTAWASGLATQWSRCNGTSLARQRDTLVSRFLETDCTHLLWVDSDIGWNVEHAKTLLATGKDFVSGCYGKKMPGAPLVGKLLPNREGDLYAAEHTGCGLLLCSREPVAKIASAAEHYQDTASGRTLAALFHQNINESTEDVAFCRRWRDLGGQIWMHTRVVVDHYDGGTPYRVDLTELRAPFQQAAE